MDVFCNKIWACYEGRVEPIKSLRRIKGDRFTIRIHLDTCTPGKINPSRRLMLISKELPLRLLLLACMSSFRACKKEKSERATQVRAYLDFFDGNAQLTQQIRSGKGKEATESPEQERERERERNQAAAMHRICLNGGS